MTQPKTERVDRCTLSELKEDDMLIIWKGWTVGEGLLQEAGQHRREG
jgi:hypothetical protein